MCVCVCVLLLFNILHIIPVIIVVIIIITYMRRPEHATSTWTGLSIIVWLVYHEMEIVSICV